MRHRDVETPIYSALSAASSLTKLCMVLSAVEREWPAIVGGVLSRRTSPRQFDQGILVVAADSASVMQDLNFKKNAIIRTIRTKARLDVRDVRVEIGSVSGGARATRVQPAKKNRLCRAGAIDARLEEALCADLAAAYADLPEALVRSIARCRIMSGTIR